MIKEVKIHTESLIEDLTDEGLVESSERSASDALGTLRKDTDTLRLSYTEVYEGEKITTKICVYGDAVTVKRNGGIECSFEFTEGKTTSSLYSVSGYSFDADIFTRKIRSSLTESGGELSLIYDMTIGGAKKKTVMKIKVTEK